MVPRYEQKEISAIWTDHNKHELYLKVELALLEALEQAGKIPSGISAKYNGVSVNLDRIHEIESVVKHDIIAFCTSVTEQVDVEFAKYFHYGVTSNDIIDTALNLQLRESLSYILPELYRTREALYKKAIEFLEIIGVGRSHGMYAEPLSFGQKFLGFYAEFSRRYDELSQIMNEEIKGQLSGAVGNYTIMDLDVEKLALEKLDLKPEPHSTQVIPRDRISRIVQGMASIANAVERLAVELRHLHRSEVAEVYEGFTKGQKGSSTMPHKKNPIATENITGIARVLRSHAMIAFENTILWHERDISHSSAERIYLPDCFGLGLYALKRLNSTLENLVVCTDVIEQRSENSSGVLSSYYLHELIRKTDLRREDIYMLVQEASFRALEENQNLGTILNRLLEEKEISGRVEVIELTDLKNRYKQNAVEVKDRVLQEYPLYN